MAKPTAIKFMHGAMSGAPVLSGTVGALISVLDSCLVTGFGLVTADSLVVTDGIASFNRSAGIGAFEIDAVLLVSGATPPELNGEKRILSTTATGVTFDAEGISNQTASGTITAKIAPLGWEKVFSGTNLAVYRSTDPTSTRFYYRVDDTGTVTARIRGYESMSDVNNGTGLFPLDSQQSGGGYLNKSSVANATAATWTIVGDGKRMYFHQHSSSGTGGVNGVSGTTHGWGDFVSNKSADAYRAFIHFETVSTNYSGQAAPTDKDLGYMYSSVGMYVSRAYHGMGASLNVNHMAESYGLSAAPTASGKGTGAVWVTTYPNPIDNTLILSRKLIMESGAIRGVLPGIYFAPQACAAYFNYRDKINATGSLQGKRIMAVGCGSAAVTVREGTFFFDIMGPWE